jgi:hypothetical protein
VARVGGEHRSASRRENIDGVMTAHAIPPFIEGIAELIRVNPGHRQQ